MHLRESKRLQHLLCYFLIALGAISLCGIPVFLKSDLDIQVIQPIVTAINSIGFKYSLVAGIAAAAPVLIDFVTDELSWSSQGAGFNILNQLVLALPNIILLLDDIYSDGDGRLFMVLYHIRVSMIQLLFFAYLSYYGAEVWGNLSMLLSSLLFFIGSILRCFALNSLSSTSDNLNIWGTVLQSLCVLVLLIYSIIWVVKIRNEPSSQFNLDRYCCNTYLICFWLMCVGLSILSGFKGVRRWYAFDGETLAIKNYIFTITIVAVAVVHGRATRRQRATAQAEQALKLKKDLVRFIGHEVRTPLNTVCMGIQYLNDKLQSGRFDTYELRQIIADIGTSCDQALGTLTQLLTYEKIDSGVEKLNKTSFDVKVFIEESLQPFYLLSKEACVSLQLHFTEDAEEKLSELCLCADRRKLALVLSNLFSNAIKFTKRVESSQKNVTVLVDIVDYCKPPLTKNLDSFKESKVFPGRSLSRIETLSSILKVQVIDNGPGISPSNIKLLFRDVVQFSPEKLQAGGGSGLGLWIAQKIVQMHEGSLKAESDGEGCGTTFTLQLDLQPIVLDNNTYVNDSMTPLPQPKIQSLGEEKSRDLVSVKSVLIVDDARLNRKMAHKLLNKYVEVIYEAEDGCAALQVLNESMECGQSFDLIMMDFVMPNMDGPTATRKIREMGYKGLIIGVTGNALDDDIKHFKVQGADDVLPKPLDLNALQYLLQENGLHLDEIQERVASLSDKQED